MTNVETNDSDADNHDDDRDDDREDINKPVMPNSTKKATISVQSYVCARPGHWRKAAQQSINPLSFLKIVFQLRLAPTTMRQMSLFQLRLSAENDVTLTTASHRSVLDDSTRKMSVLDDLLFEHVGSLLRKAIRLRRGSVFVDYSHSRWLSRLIPLQLLVNYDNAMGN